MKRGVLIVWVAVLGCIGTAHAQVENETSSEDQEARQLFEAGQLAYEAGRFDAALDHFMRAHELSGRPRLLYNIGQAADRLRRDRTALEAFKRYVREIPNAENADMVRNRIAVLEATLKHADERTALRSTDSVPSSNTSDAAHLNETREAATPESPIYARWWFLAGAGAVVLGAVVTLVALISGDTYARAPAGTDGITVASVSSP